MLWTTRDILWIYIVDNVPICCGVLMIYCGYMLWVALHMLWTYLVGYTGDRWEGYGAFGLVRVVPCYPPYPQHIILMFSTTYHPQHIQRVFSTTYTPCSPQYITCAPQYIILAQKCSPRYSKNIVLYVVGVSIPEHVVENTLYIVGSCCGAHSYVVECISCGVLYVVDNVHILWGYIVDNSYSSYMLWVTISCG